MRSLPKWIGMGVAVVILVLIAGWLALQRGDIDYDKLEAKYANSQSRFMDMPDGVHLHYRDEGLHSGPTLVMVHGFSASLQAWSPWVARLGDHYRIISLDLPGHGLTRAPKGYAASIDGYADLVDQTALRLGSGPYVVIGNSMGGGVAWHDALRHPNHVRALVLVDAAGWPGQGQPQGGPLIFKLLRNPIARALIRNIDTRWLAKDGLEKAYVDPALVTPALLDRYAELARAPGHRDILLTIRQDAAGSITPQTFKAIHVPTLVMHGEEDALIPLADGKGFASGIAGAKLVTYPKVGHVPMEQIPDQSALDLGAFLTSLPDTAIIGPR